MADRNLSDLDPRLQPLAEAFLTASNRAVAPSRVVIDVTWRDSAAQDAAHAAGLSNAVGGQSPHNCLNAAGQPAALAFDFAVLDEDGDYVENGADARYTTCGEVAESLGLKWGGTWSMAKDGCNPDTDHVQFDNWKTMIAVA